MNHNNTPSRFNIRVYGIWLDEGRLLINEEIIRGHRVIKLPGGGLELGEGLADGLKREWREELGVEIMVLQHFYTTDFFQPSAYDDSQVISVYYLVRGDAGLPIINHERNERTYWQPLYGVNEDLFTLAIDKVVGGLLEATYNN